MTATAAVAMVPAKSPRISLAALAVGRITVVEMLMGSCEGMSQGSLGMSPLLVGMIVAKKGAEHHPAQT